MKYPFVTLATNTDPPFPIFDKEDFVERSGYRTIEQEVKSLIANGERLIDWRKAENPGEGEGEPFPVFLDTFTAFDRMQVIQKRFELFQAQREEEALAESEPKEPVVEVKTVDVAEPKAKA